MSDSTRLIYGAFFVSLAIHLVVLFTFNATDFFNLRNNSPQRVEVSLRAKPAAPNPSAVLAAKILPKKEPIYQPKEIERKEILKGVLGQKAPKSPENLKIFERSTEKFKGLNAVKKVSIPMLDSEKINDPKYEKYKIVIKEAISEIMYRKFSQVQEKIAGEVYLTFLITKEGVLKEVKIIEEKSSANESLRRLALEGIRETKFTPFLKDFEVSEMTFNTQIIFQVDSSR